MFKQEIIKSSCPYCRKTKKIAIVKEPRSEVKLLRVKCAKCYREFDAIILPNEGQS